MDAAVNWAAVVTVTPPDQPGESSELGLTVTTTGLAVRVGAKAPAVPTPTSARASGVLASITTDTSPDPRSYQLSEDQALAEHKPFVLVFATPAFCTSRDFGPTLDAVKAVAKGEPAMIAALDGHPAEALSLYRGALRAWRDLGLAWDEALCVIDMATLLDPTDPEVHAAADAAREILTRLGAKPFLARLEAAMQRHSSQVRHEPSSPVSGERVAAADALKT